MNLRQHSRRRSLQECDIGGVEIGRPVAFNEAEISAGCGHNRLVADGVFSDQLGHCYTQINGTARRRDAQAHAGPVSKFVKSLGRFGLLQLAYVALEHGAEPLRNPVNGNQGDPAILSTFNGRIIVHQIAFLKLLGQEKYRAVLACECGVDGPHRQTFVEQAHCVVLKAADQAVRILAGRFVHCQVKL